MQVVTECERPDLRDECREAFQGHWPQFILHDPITKKYIDRTQPYFPDLDILLLDEGRVVAGGWAVAMGWDGSLADLPAGYDGALVRAVEGHEAGVPVNTLCLMAIAVSGKQQRRGLAGSVIAALRDRGAEQHLSQVIAPVRPTLKPQYPLATMERFASWRRADGQHLDPWVRTHVRMGAKILGSAARSQVVRGCVADWEGWTGMAFPDTAAYVVPGALGLVHIDREADQGVYEEDNLWVQHVGPDDFGERRELTPPDRARSEA